MSVNDYRQRQQASIRWHKVLACIVVEGCDQPDPALNPIVCALQDTVVQVELVVLQEHRAAGSAQGSVMTLTRLHSNQSCQRNSGATYQQHVNSSIGQ